ncbi:MAG: P-loop NTPase [Planctomycetes bacterium]|nr:P-loop NTPase [Planctomycetota bacterium]
MNWDQARKLLHRNSDSFPGGPEPHPGSVPTRAGMHRVRGGSLCVASGKGGTGKSVVTASLATLMSRAGRTLIVDADMGVGNAHILQGVAPEHSFVDLVEGRCGVRDIRATCGENLDLLAAGSGVSRMAALSSWEMHLVAGGIEEIEGEYAHVIVDSAAGISNQTVALAAACDLVLIVTTPDITALTDAYAFLKVLFMRSPECAPLFVVNRASSFEEGVQVAERLCGVARRFLRREPRCVGVLPDDRAVVRCVNSRAPVVAREPDSPFAKAVTLVHGRLQTELSREAGRGLGQSLLRIASEH